MKKATVSAGKKRTGKIADGRAGSRTDDDEGTEGEAGQVETNGRAWRKRRWSRETAQSCRNTFNGKVLP